MTVHVDGIVNYFIFNPVMSVNNIYNANAATQLLAQTILRNILGSHKLSELLELRETIQEQLQQQLDEATDHWGVKVEKVLIKDVRIPRDLQRSMAAEAEASREAKAKVRTCVYSTCLSCGCVASLINSPACCSAACSCHIT